jgi:hypothetical protein
MTALPLRRIRRPSALVRRPALKEQILHLDPHDDFISARDKMGWVQTQRVYVVWPPRGRVLTRRLDLMLLHRHAHRLGAQLALISRDNAVRDHARELGLAVFDSLEASYRTRWRSRLPRIRPERRQARPDTEAIRLARKAAERPRWVHHLWLMVRVILFLVSVVAVGALAYALIPSASITLVPATRPLSVTVELAADPNLRAASLADLQAPILIPARPIRVEVETQGFVATTGSKDVPSLPATGRVVFTNLIGTAATIPQGTSLRTTSGTPVRFVTAAPAAIEGRLGATVQVEVRAVEAGPAGNIGVARLNAIDGPLGLQLAVTNPISTTGGTLEKRAAVSPADRDRLRAQLLDELRLTAQGAIEAQLQPGEFLAADTITLTQVLAETFDFAPGEAADALGLTLRVAASAVAVSEAEARSAAQAALEAQVPTEAALTDAPIQFQRSPELSVDADGRVRFSLNAQGWVVPQIDREQVRALVQHQRPDRAVQRLQAALPLAAPPQIQLFPEGYAQWYPYLPWMLFRINVIVQ